MATAKGMRANTPTVQFRATDPRGWNLELTQRSLDCHWENMPLQAKGFLLNARDGFLSLEELVDFWTSPQGIESLNDGCAGTMCKTSWLLAIIYKRFNMAKEARALMLNGAFLRHCYESSIKSIEQLCKSNAPKEVLEERLPCFMDGLKTARFPNLIDSFIERYIPEENMKLLTSYADRTIERSMDMTVGTDRMGFVDQISDDWDGSRRVSRKKLHEQNMYHGVPMQLIFVDDENESERRSFDVTSSTILKALFNEYAEKRGISLRSLRFSHAGDTLFLSSAGRKTPEQLGMRDQDIIMVHDTSSTPQSTPQGSNASVNKRGKPKQKSKKHKKRNKKKRHEVIQNKNSMEQTEATEEELKIEHSKILSKVHYELHPRLKQIRQYLNNLVIQRSQPKMRSKFCNSKSVTPLPRSFVNNPCTQDLGGKAGKSHFVINVGEVENLYKTTKLSVQSSHSHCSTSTLDLHGCTRDEALLKLGQSLNGWIDVAMQGCYPFMMQAVIVCGCGNQILRETVQEWIKSSSNVSNAPKRRLL
jgi:hypothetical protein